MTGRFANALGALAASRWGAGGKRYLSLKEVNDFLTVRNTIENNPVILQVLERFKVERN